MSFAPEPQSTAALSIEQELAQTTNQLLQTANALHQSGEFQRAADLCQAILEILPSHADANHCLGCLLVQTRQPAAGLPHLEAALAAQPAQEPYWLSYVDALIQAGQAATARQVLATGQQHGLKGAAVDDLAARLAAHPQPANLPTIAKTALRTRLGHHKASKGKRKPSAVEIGAVLKLLGQGRLAEVEALARTLSIRFPNDGFGWKVLGAVLQEQGSAQEALLCMQNAVRLLPGDAEAMNNLGATLQRQRQPEEAEVAIRRALVLRPGYAEAHMNLGNSLHSQRRHTEAEACQRQALAINSDYAKAHMALGVILQEQGRLTEATASLRRAVVLSPDFAEAYINLGNTLQNQCLLTEAISSYRRALELRGNNAPAHSNLLFCLAHDVMTDSRQLLAEHLAFGEKFEAPLRAGWQPHNNSKDPGRCLQVGFVSADLHNHAVASFLEPVLELLFQKSTLSLHAYYNHTIEDAVTQRLRTYFNHWHAVVSLSDANLAERVRADGIDMLIDLSGHTAGNRLLTFARKPAPIQATWLGYPGTTGLQAMDYHLCDQFFVPTELSWQFTEKSAFLPASAIFQPSEHAPPVNELPALENSFLTFGSFNRPNKLNDSVIVLWCMLLRGIPNARMVLGAIPEKNQDVLIQSFANEGIDQDRLTFFPRSNIQDYLALHHQVDICLDTYPYGGGTTTAHAAWMGVPTLTLAGETPASRSGATFMNQLGLNEFIATSIDDFVDKGHFWSEHIDELAALRIEMRTRFNASAMGQPERFADSLETTLRTMWHRWCSDLPPATIESKSDAHAYITEL